VSSILGQHASPVRQGLIRTSAVTTAAALAALSVAACSSSSSSSNAASSTAIFGSALKQDCTNVADVLSDGPDPDADPVGYAEAQILPLRQLTIGDAKLHQAVLTLAGAYQAFSAGTKPGGAAAALKVSKAEAAVNAICPQAAQ
jgi:hypothetical protein